MNRLVTGSVIMLIALALVSNSTIAQTSVKESLPNGWHLQDLKESGAHGISLDKAYQLVKGKKSKTVIVAVIDSGVDTLLNFDTAAFAISKEAYMGEDNKWENRWKEIATNKYDHLYFDDNIGSFLVQVEIRKSK